MRREKKGVKLQSGTVGRMPREGKYDMPEKTDLGILSIPQPA